MEALGLGIYYLIKILNREEMQKEKIWIFWKFSCIIYI